MCGCADNVCTAVLIFKDVHIETEICQMFLLKQLMYTYIYFYYHLPKALLDDSETVDAFRLGLTDLDFPP